MMSGSGGGLYLPETTAKQPLECEAFSYTVYYILYIIHKYTLSCQFIGFLKGMHSYTTVL